MTGTGERAPAARPATAPAVPRPIEVLLAEAGIRAPATADGAATGLAEGVARCTVGPATLYRFPPDRSAQREHFVTVLARLADAAPFALPRLIGEIDGWVVLVRPDGQPAHKPELHPDPDDLVVAVAAGMRAMHDIPVPALRSAVGPGERSGRPALAELCRRAVEAGLVSSDRLPAPYNRYGPAELLELFIEWRRPGVEANGPEPGRDPASPEAGSTVPADEPGLVCCHGFAGAERFMVDNGRFVGFDRIEAPIVADRHLDLAIVHQSLQQHFGPEAVFRFYDAYGQDPDLVLLDHYVLASHLLGRTPATSAARPAIP